MSRVIARFDKHGYIVLHRRLATLLVGLACLIAGLVIGHFA